MIHDEEYFFLTKPSMTKTIHSRPAYDDAFKNDTYHRKEKCVDEDETRYENSFIRETIRQIEKTNHDKKTDKNRFDNRKYFFDDTDESLDGVELLKCKNDSDNSVARRRQSHEIRKVYRTIRKLNTRDKVSRHTDFTRYQKCSYDDEELKRDTN
jgi:hypothetical protein